MTALTVTKKLPKSWKIAGKVATEIEFREATLEDLIEAEKEANPTFAPNGFNAALAARTCVRAGAFTGPFAPGHFRTMPTKNWYIVREAIAEAESLGEDAPESPAQSV
ncbi:hypothetical protein [Variovorax gossypii]